MGGPPRSPPGSSGRLSGPVRVSNVKRLWRKVPVETRERLYGAVSWTGLPYLMSYLASYLTVHSEVNFAGNLIPLREEFRKSSGERRQRLGRRFDAIADAMVLPNGVRRTTYSERQNAVLERVLDDEACRPDAASLRVLDVPASSGIASLASLDLLSRHYRVSRYVLGDISFQAFFDRERDCIFDEAGNLLQVRRGRRFSSIYRPHDSGNEVSVLTDILLFPLTMRSWRLKRRLRFSAAVDVVPLSLVHPEVEARLGDGVLGLQQVDVFQDIEGEYDLILSFNLLQRNYFSTEAIARGTANLGRRLSDGGVLVMGRPDAQGATGYLVARKRGGELVVVRREGRF